MTSRKLLLLIGLTVLVFVGLGGYGDFREVGTRLARFPVTHLAVALGLAAINFGLRFCRWAYFLRILRIDVPAPVSVLIFLSGLALSVTPGKAGELIKSYLLRDRTDVPVSASAPVVVMERLTDVVSVVLLALVGLVLLPRPVVAVLLAVLVLCGVAIGLLATRRGDRVLELPVLRRWRDELRTSQEGMRRLAAPSVIGVAVLLGALAWLSEGVALWVILKGLDAQVSMARAVPVYAAATLVGAVSAMPGGLVGTEGTMVALLQQGGIGRGASSVATLIVRLVTLWFAVAIGLVAMLCLNRIRGVPATSSPAGDQDGRVYQAPGE